MAARITVVVSQGQSQSPAKRNLEEEIVTTLLMEGGVELVVIPHLYDLEPEGTGMLALQSIPGDMIILSWLFPRAARWILDRHNIRGREGVTLLVEESDEDEEEPEATEDENKERVIDTRELPNRKIYCLDLRQHSSARPYIDEVKRIASEQRQQVVELMGWMQGSAQPAQMQRFLQPTNDTGLNESGRAHSNGSDGNGDDGNGNGGDHAEAITEGSIQPRRIDEQAGRRWYPVIDYSRCTNCMECIDFCLFGVYGVDNVETILVEQPDNCRKGCPACSRVCPENAIIFPQHKTPAIAGAAVGNETLKIDLSQLFGAPDTGESALEAAARERDEQLVMAGREAVGMAVGMPKRQADGGNEPKDDLDNLLDQLDELDL